METNFFSAEQRLEICTQLIQMCQLDEHTTAGAFVGSFALEKQDRWSDIDISFAISENCEVKDVLDRWTASIEAKTPIVHHFDVARGGAIYRVILLDNGLEIDLSGVPELEFGAKSEKFKLIFGSTTKDPTYGSPVMQDYVGWGWHHILHTNAAINRGNLWQAEFWIGALKNILVSMKCVRYKLPYDHGRGVDGLNNKEKQGLEEMLVNHVEKDALRTHLNVGMKLYLDEVKTVNKELSNKLSIVLRSALSARPT